MGCSSTRTLISSISQTFSTHVERLFFINFIEVNFGA
uniref:Uncharacterized protein n=1 Tax=Rhizophora mucronata TaxID=61149 RepID=A0A2P2NA76_RHIMU